jgi:hypothetical protein
MEKEFDFSNHQVGDKVYHVVRGWAVIEQKEQNFFSVKGEAVYYNGKLRELHENPTIYPFNPFEQTEERMVEVYLEVDNIWIEKTLIKELKNGEALCWIQNKLSAHVWKKWREIQPKKELTTKEKIDILWEKHNNNG